MTALEPARRGPLGLALAVPLRHDRPMASNPIRPALFRFLEELAAHNDRVGFQDNKQRYRDEVRDPLLHFIADFAPRLKKVSRHMEADPRPVGGSLFRIHRDTRFAKDKRPYKTHAGITFRHVQGRDVHGPIFYLHLEPGNVFAASGIWMPPSDTLGRIRDAIVEAPAAWRKVSRAIALDGGHGDDDGKLKRAPRGYDPEHPHVEDLKRKSFTSSASFDERKACAPGFAVALAQQYAAARPLMKFLTQAVALPF